MRSAVRGVRSACIYCSLLIVPAGLHPVLGDEPPIESPAETPPKYLSLTQLDAYIELRAELTPGYPFFVDRHPPRLVIPRDRCLGVGDTLNGRNHRGRPVTGIDPE